MVQNNFILLKITHPKIPVLHLFNLSHTLKKPSALKYIYMIFKVLFLPITSCNLQSKPVSGEEL